MGLLDAINARLDAFENVLTSMGTSADKGSSFTITLDDVTLTKEQLQHAYRRSYYARRIIDVQAEDALVRGFSIKDPTNPRGTQDPRWGTLFRDHRLVSKLIQAAKYDGALGTGYIVPITFDGNDLDEPLDLTSLYTVSDIMVFSPEELRPEEYWLDNTAGARITEPASYRIYLPNMAALRSAAWGGKWGEVLAGRKTLHPSRVIPVVGRPLGPLARMTHPFALGDSITQVIFLALARADAIDAAGAILAQEIKQDVITIPDLKAIGTSDAASAFQLRMRLLKLSKGLLNMIVLGQGEVFESRANTVTGFKDLADNSRNALVAASGMPEALVFGKATSGLAVAPGTEQEGYFRKIDGYRAAALYDPVVRVCKMLAAAKLGPFRGDRRYFDFEVEFSPLLRETDKEKDSRKLIQTQRDSIHVGMLATQDPALGAAFARYIISGRYGEYGWQSDLPPFNPAEYGVHEGALAGEPAPEGGAASEDPARPHTPDGQTPTRTLPSGATNPTKMGAQGVDLQAQNTGKGRFDANFANGVEAEWALIDAGEYVGPIYRIPASMRAYAARAVTWRATHPETASLLPEAEWARIEGFARRETVGETTLLVMRALHEVADEFHAAVRRATVTKKPWLEAALVRRYGWGGPNAVLWATSKTIDVVDNEEDEP